MEGGSRRDDTSKFIDQGTNREALIPSGVRKRLRSITTFNIQNYEKGDLEIDCADFDIDSDCTGDDAGSDVVYVREEEERELGTR